MNQEEVKKTLFVPQKYFDGSLEEFWQAIPEMDPSFEERREKLAKEGKRLRFVASYDHGQCEVGLREVEQGHPFYDLEEQQYHPDYHRAVQRVPHGNQGIQVSASVTTAGVFSDIISIANIR